jgi:3,4-dihydroxy 2-butanone 4-phosphate synthase / GTP cyclohydrolase II
MSRIDPSPFDPVETAIQAIAEGRIVIVTDDEDRENEGDLVMAAAKATPEAINMMIRHGRGLICVPALAHHLKRLGINPMVQENRESHQTDFTVSVDAASGITTGISAYDRARTIRLLADPETRPDDLVQPGHVFPLRGKPGGVLQRAGHTEASVDLASLAGLPPIGVLCEILNEDGSLARLPDLVLFKEKFNLPMISIADLIEYRHQREQLVEEVGVHPFESEFGTFQLHVFRSSLDQHHHLALTMGALDDEPTLVRVQSENILSDVFHAAGKDGSSRHALTSSLRKVSEAGKGVVVYIGQPDGGLTPALRGSPPPTGPNPAKSGPGGMDFRNYGIGAQILVALGLKQIRLLSSHTRHVVALEGYNLKIVEQVQL